VAADLHVADEISVFTGLWFTQLVNPGFIFASAGSSYNTVPIANAITSITATIRNDNAMRFFLTLASIRTPPF
jgi:hypothetical protein